MYKFCTDVSLIECSKGPLVLKYFREHSFGVASSFSLCILTKTSVLFKMLAAEQDKAVEPEEHGDDEGDNISTIYITLS